MVLSVVPVVAVDHTMVTLRGQVLQDKVMQAVTVLIATVAVAVVNPTQVQVLLVVQATLYLQALVTQVVVAELK